VILHLIDRDVWLASGDLGVHPPSLATEGFAHCSTAAQMVGVADRFYRGTPNLVLLVIDPDRLTSELRWEPPAHPDGTPAKVTDPLFPHVFGPIDVAAVVDVVPFPCRADGTFVLPPGLDQTG
jgi:uncharacterized protein (DUF952 family)